MESTQETIKTPEQINCECFADLKWLLDDPIEIEILIRIKE